MTKQRRRLIATILISLIIAATVLWILNSEHIIQGDWSNILSTIFIALAILLSLIQWLYPFSSNEPEPPLSSNLTLIDAALDPHDSPYEQTIDKGRKKIRYRKSDIKVRNRIKLRKMNSCASYFVRPF